MGSFWRPVIWHWSSLMSRCCPSNYTASKALSGKESSVLWFYFWPGHVMALATPLQDMEKKESSNCHSVPWTTQIFDLHFYLAALHSMQDEYVREIFFFNMATYLEGAEQLFLIIHWFPNYFCLAAVKPVDNVALRRQWRTATARHPQERSLFRLDFQSFSRSLQTHFDRHVRHPSSPSNQKHWPCWASLLLDLQADKIQNFLKMRKKSFKDLQTFGRWKGQVAGGHSFQRWQGCGVVRIDSQATTARRFSWIANTFAASLSLAKSLKETQLGKPKGKLLA